MTKDDLKWEIESRLRIGISYSGYRYSFFSTLNVALCIVALASLWLSGVVFSGEWPRVSMALNIICSVSLVVDVALNIKGFNGYWSAMYDGYNEMLSELFSVQENASAEQLSELRSRMYTFDGRCKSVKNALCLIAWNDACVQMGKSEHVKHVPFYKRWTANIFSWGSAADNFK